MNNWWIRFGCFLTGYNYAIVRNSSEVAAKTVKRYTAALMIVTILWSFIGYSFTKRYVHGGNIGSVVGAVIFVVIIIQIERQIILAINPSKWLYIFRGIIAMMMAIIGAIIIDQIIFKEDIDLEKMSFIEAKVKKALVPKTEELRNQIANLDTAIFKKEFERSNIIAEVTHSPSIALPSTQVVQKSQTTQTVDSLGRRSSSSTIKPVLVAITTSTPNPKIALIAPLEETIKNLRIERSAKEIVLLNIRPQLEREISSKVGFLDELEVMYSLITRSGVAMTIWLIWFFFLLGLEMLVLISKVNEKESDYERTVKHHMDLQIKRLELLAKN